jgi:hypothetical protein
MKGVWKLKVHSDTEFDISKMLFIDVTLAMRLRTFLTYIDYYVFGVFTKWNYVEN